MRREGSVDWLTFLAWALTIGCLGCAVLDSYTSLCIVGGTLGRIGSAGSCPGFGGWDTRTFPLAVDMGWGGALFAVLRLAKTIGLRSWRWWAVLAFEGVTAAFTIAGNGFHGLVEAGVTLPHRELILVSLVASAVPGVTAVGSGFTLSVLVSSHLAASSRLSQRLGDKVLSRETGGVETGQTETPETGRRGRTETPRGDHPRSPVGLDRADSRGARERGETETARPPTEVGAGTLAGGWEVSQVRDGGTRHPVPETPSETPNRPEAPPVPVSQGPAETPNETRDRVSQGASRGLSPAAGDSETGDERERVSRLLRDVPDITVRQAAGRLGVSPAKAGRLLKAARALRVVEGRAAQA